MTPNTNAMIGYASIRPTLMNMLVSSWPRASCRPAEQAQPHGECLCESLRGHETGEQSSKHNDQHFAREDVAEQTEGQRDRLGQLHDNLERGQGRERLEEMLDVAARTTRPRTEK